jgi:hypothetical protein
LQVCHADFLNGLGFIARLGGVLLEHFPDLIRDAAIVGWRGDGVSLGVGLDLLLMVGHELLGGGPVDPESFFEG